MKLIRLSFIALLAHLSTSAPTTTVFGQLKIGAGGWVTGIDVSRDGTRVARCDTFGAYKWDPKASSWFPLLTSSSMPTGDFGVYASMQYGGGIYEVAIAPNSPNTIYAVYNGYVFRTDNGGTNFTRTAFAQQAMEPNDEFRTISRKMAVDSASAGVVYVGTQRAGLWRSLNSGASWAMCKGVANSTSNAGVLMAIDHSSPIVSGRRSIVYAISNGNGVYRSSDGGDNFVLLNGSPTQASKMVCGPDGSVFVTDNTVKCYRYRGGTWSSSDVYGGAWHTVAVNPLDANHVVAGSDAGQLRVSFDGGLNFTGIVSTNRTATDIPWLAWTNEFYMSSGDIVFDPATPGSLLFGQGIGVWNTSSLNGTATSWFSQSRGIEQLVTNFLLSPPGGKPMTFVWDRGVFTIADPAQYPSQHGPTRETSIVHGWHGDYATGNPKFIAGIFNRFGAEYSGYSTDGGDTWTKFSTLPPDVVAGKIGGCIATTTDQSILWTPSNNAAPWVTQDRGNTWKRIDISGINSTGETGWGWAYYFNRKIVAADRVEPNTYYLYNYLSPVGGVFRSKDSGVTWERMFAGPLTDWSMFHAKLRTVPYRAGHLFFTAGAQSGTKPALSQFKHSIDGGRNWTVIPNVLEVYAFGFGKPQTDGGYPAIFIAGFVNTKWGVYSSYDECKTWTFLTDYPNGNFDSVSTVEGDLNVFGRVYVGFGGSGSSYGDLGTPTPAPTPAPTTTSQTTAQTTTSQTTATTTSQTTTSQTTTTRPSTAAPASSTTGPTSPPSQSGASRLLSSMLIGVALLSLL